MVLGWGNELFWVRVRIWNVFGFIYSSSSVLYLMICLGEQKQMRDRLSQDFRTPFFHVMTMVSRTAQLQFSFL